MNALTPKQKRIWRYVKTCARSPSYREMARVLEIAAAADLRGITLSLPVEHQ